MDDMLDEMGATHIRIYSWVLARWECLRPPSISTLRKRFPMKKLHKKALSEMVEKGYLALFEDASTKFIVPIGLDIRFRLIPGSPFGEVTAERGLLAQSEYVTTVREIEKSQNGAQEQATQTPQCPPEIGGPRPVEEADVRVWNDDRVADSTLPGPGEPEDPA